MREKESKFADGCRAVETNSGGKKSNMGRYKILKENCSEEVVGQQHGAAGLTLPIVPDTFWASKCFLGALSGWEAY